MVLYRSSLRLISIFLSIFYLSLICTIHSLHTCTHYYPYTPPLDQTPSKHLTLIKTNSHTSRHTCLICLFLQIAQSSLHYGIFIYFIITATYLISTVISHNSSRKYSSLYIRDPPFSSLVFN